MNRIRQIDAGIHWVCLALWASFAAYISADDQTPSFEKDVLPLLAVECHACHGAETREAKLDLRTLSEIMRGGGFKAGHIHGATDEFGDKSVEIRVSDPDLHATILNQMGIDHTKLTFTHSGRPERLTDPDVTGARVVEELLV